MTTRFSAQDARSGGNRAIQSNGAAAPTKVKVKTSAVKVVRPAGPVNPSAPRNPFAPAAAPVAPVAPSRSKEADVAPPTPQKSVHPSDAQQFVDMLKARALSQTPRSSPKIMDDAEVGLDAMFARLTSPAPSVRPSPGPSAKENIAGGYVMVPSSPEAQEDISRPFKIDYNFSHGSPVKDDKKDAASDKASRASMNNNTVVKEEPGSIRNVSEMTTEIPGDVKKEPVVVKTESAGDSPTAPVKVENTPDLQGASQADVEQRYLQKALEYLQALSLVEDTDARLVWTVADKLQRVSNPETSVNPSDIGDLKSKLINAIADYVAKLNSVDSIDPGWFEEILQNNDGNFFSLCAKLVERQLIKVISLDDVLGLCTAVMEVIPKEEIKKASGLVREDSKVEHMKPQEEQQEHQKAENVKPEEKKVGLKKLVEKKTAPTAWKDPMEKMTAWPAQQKRDNIAGCRTVILKGVSHPATINQVQSLVWGGRLESVHAPEAGKSFAMVKFQTAEGCLKYFDATENGIEWPGDKTKTLIFVERQPTPNSVNDLLQNCIDGNITRCVRAVDADDDWSMSVLHRLARGSSKIPRDVDRIKQGKTGRGRHYIEFRFGNVYHALNFKRELMSEEDWEACTIGYVEDPCALARGVHITDEDEA